jgi:hypothetical protein
MATPSTNTVDPVMTGDVESPEAPVAPAVPLMFVGREAEVAELPPARAVALPTLHETNDPEATATAVSTASHLTVSPTSALRYSPHRMIATPNVLLSRSGHRVRSTMHK